MEEDIKSFLELPKITEYDNGVFIDDYRLPLVIKDSIHCSAESTVTLTVVVRSYERIFEKIEPTVAYGFREDQ